MRLYFARTDRGLVPADELTAEQVQKWGIGEVVACDTKRSRNVQHHRKAFALLRILLENQDRHETMRSFLVEIKIRLGWYEEHITVAGALVYEPLSIAFDQMDQDAFEAEFYKPLTRLALAEYLPEGMTEAQLEAEVMRRLQF